MIDSHCHLADEVFAADLDAVVARARDAGVERALVDSRGGRYTARRRRPRALEELWPDVRFAIGVHPHAAHEFAGRPGAGGRRRARADCRDAVGAGGRRDRPRLPLRFLAARRAAGGVPRAGRGWRASSGCRSSSTPVKPTRTPARSSREEGGGEVRGVLHCFTGTAALARAGLELGFYISLAGIVTFPKAHELRETVEARAARSAAGRNRQPVSGAGAASRQAQRAGACRAGRRRAGATCTDIDAGRDRRGARRANFHAPVPAVIKFLG